MPIVKRQWELLITEEKRAQLLKEIITYFETKMDQEIGLVAANDVLDFFLRELGEDVQKKALNDARQIIKQNLENLEVDLDLLTGK
jgi:uncharacterized protein (DUF2164 family)